MIEKGRCWLRCSLFLWMVLVLGFGTVAFAQETAFERAINLSREAMEEYDNFELDLADSKILEAVRLLESERVTDKGVASVYVAQGVVGYGRFKDSAPVIAQERAYSAFLKAVSLDPGVELPIDYRTSDLEAILIRAREAISHGSTPAVSTASAPNIDHKVVISGERCVPIELTATVPAHPDIYRIMLRYQSDGLPLFSAIEMVPDIQIPTMLRATIPGSAARGAQVRYFIEATNRSGDVVTAVGSDTRPLTTMLSGKCVGLPEDDPTEKYGDPLFQLTIAAGTGFGLIKGMTENCLKSSLCISNDSQAYNGVGFGAALVPFFVRASAVFNLPADFQLGAYIRGQVVNIVKDNAQASIMVGATLRYLAIARQPYRLYIGLGFGWGGANATVFLGKQFKDFKDVYIFRGPVHIAPEIGFLWSFHRNVGLAIELAVPVHFPDDPRVHFDLSIGPYFQF
ncbi:MAG: hypothetical protein FWC40_02975 [Proteobacteria bacterium]|nr:hypothetical protein [Pseudomonadota bacterium]